MKTNSTGVLSVTGRAMKEAKKRNVLETGTVASAPVTTTKGWVDVTELPTGTNALPSVFRLAEKTDPRYG